MSKMRLYLAGASRELDRVKNMAFLLDTSGTVEIAHRWWRSVEEAGVGADWTLDRETQAARAAEDLAALRRSHLVWVLWPLRVSAGAHVELGFALAKKIPVVITGWGAHRCIFTAAPEIYREGADLLGLHEVLKRARDHVEAHSALAFVT